MLSQRLWQTRKLWDASATEQRWARLVGQGVAGSDGERQIMRRWRDMADDLAEHAIESC